jgi:hypothetical protein
MSVQSLTRAGKHALQRKAGDPFGAQKSAKLPEADRPAGPGGYPALETALVARVHARWHARLAEACAYSSVPVEFLGALVANESGGDPRVARFEPAVYRHLVAVAQGRSPAYASLRREALEAEVADRLHPKADAYHAAALPPAFGAQHAAVLTRSSDEALRELATSWGLTQIMGYHLVGRPGTVPDLLEPRFHFRLALTLLAEFAERYQLDLAREFAALFRCWNTGRPYGETHDPKYVPRGLARMKIYEELNRQGTKPPSDTGHGGSFGF